MKTTKALKSYIDNDIYSKREDKERNDYSLDYETLMKNQKKKENQNLTPNDVMRRDSQQTTHEGDGDNADKGIHLPAPKCVNATSVRRERPADNTPKTQFTEDMFKEKLLRLTNHQLGCMLECYANVIGYRIGFSKEEMQLIEIASKLK